MNSMRREECVMRIFIAGSTGVLGKRIVPRLVSMGHKVVGLSRNSETDQWLMNNGAIPRRGDLLHKESLYSATADCDVVIHLAARMPARLQTAIDDWVLNERNTIEGTANLIAVSLRSGVALYIQASVTLLYGRRHGEWVDESCPPAQDLPPLLRASVELEKLVRDSILHDRLRAIILRFGNVYSGDSECTTSMYELISRGKFPLIERGNSYWNLVFADDAAEAVIAAVRNGAPNVGKVYNVCDDEPVKHRELVEFLARSLGAPKPVSIPSFLAKTAIGWQTVDCLLHSVRCINRRAKEDLRWVLTYPSYREGHEAIMKFWRESQDDAREVDKHHTAV